MRGQKRNTQRLKMLHIGEVNKNKNCVHKRKGLKANGILGNRSKSHNIRTIRNGFMLVSISLKHQILIKESD